MQRPNVRRDTFGELVDLAALLEVGVHDPHLFCIPFCNTQAMPMCLKLNGNRELDGWGTRIPSQTRVEALKYLTRSVFSQTAAVLPVTVDHVCGPRNRFTKPQPIRPWSPDPWSPDPWPPDPCPSDLWPSGSCLLRL